MTTLNECIISSLKELSDDGYDVSNANIELLEEAVREEIEFGSDHPIFDIILDLNDTVGLDKFEIVK